MTQQLNLFLIHMGMVYEKSHIYDEEKNKQISNIWGKRIISQKCHLVGKTKGPVPAQKVFFLMLCFIPSQKREQSYNHRIIDCFGLEGNVKANINYSYRQ